MGDDDSLRIAHGNQAEPERTGGLDELQACLDRRRVANEAHRWVMVEQMLQAEAFTQDLHLLLGRADQKHAIVGSDHLLQHRRGQIAPWTHRNLDSVYQPEQEGGDTAVEQYVGCLRIRRPE